MCSLSSKKSPKKKRILSFDLSVVMPSRPGLDPGSPDKTTSLKIPRVGNKFFSQEIADQVRNDTQIEFI